MVKPRIVSLQRLYWHLIWVAIGSCFLFFGSLVASHFGWANLLLVIFFAGSLGAVVSNAQRIGNLAKLVPALQADDNPTSRPLTSTVHILQLYASLVVSGVLGFVCYGLFLSGLLEGDLFPTFNGFRDTAFSSMADFLGSIKPEHNHDAAKAIAWSFVAGYSEKFIPNVLDKLAQTTEQNPAQAQTSPSEA